MNNGIQKKVLKKDEIFSITQETAIIAASNSACTPLNFALETIKTKKQQNPVKSYSQLASSLYQQGGAKRFFHGYPSYLVRNSAGCFAGSAAMVASLHSMENSDLSMTKKIVVASVVEGLAETTLFPVEIHELAAKTSQISEKSYNKQSMFNKETAQRGMQAVGCIASRNIIYGAGVVIPFMMNSNMGATFAYGMAAGLLSLPADVMATRSFANNTNPLKTAINMLKSDKKTAFAGAMVRGLQIGIYSLATNQALHYNKKYNQPMSR